ncbi:MAG TPA: ribosome biogenesis GTPase Der [Candidatus Onthenecus intestinigallinarum]|uniref:GTPase Der n=1 Tax=Candidatus Onthenecus intestinigallinarum TaxID=2840875 RepID=A0A9D1CSF9_9FIRM|nr:ribosome biogenesis GTPase Der [Candidatus Onthenecus intestinigallinarum]
MAKPLVAVVGRPNVGKSTFFNRIAGRRISIVEDTPGVTRDRIYADVEWLGRPFTLIDTGGIDPRTDDILLAQMRRQAEIAIETCDVILFFVDGRAGMTADDMDVANMLRRTNKPVLLVVNKVDVQEMHDAVYDFYALGIGEPIAISSANMLGLGDLLDEIVKLLPQETTAQDEGEEHVIQVAIVGRPNVGKSSLTNRLLGQNRTMVSDIPGTTRDAIDTELLQDGARYNIIDTAGIRRKRTIEDDSIERYSIVRSLTAVRRCDVCVIVIDANDGVTEQDTKIAGYAHDEGKAAVVVVNKWDALEKDDKTLESYRKKVIEDLKFMSYAPVLFISALTGQRTGRVLQAVKAAYEQYSKRVTTGVLNDVLADATAALQPPVSGGRRLKIYYATQQSACPPAFVLFINDETLMHFAYERYLENQFRKAFGFEGTPIRFILRQKQKEN